MSTSKSLDTLEHKYKVVVSDVDALITDNRRFKLMIGSRAESLLLSLLLYYMSSEVILNKLHRFISTHQLESGISGPRGCGTTCATLCTSVKHALWCFFNISVFEQTQYSSTTAE